MSDLISRQAAIDEVMNMVNRHKSDEFGGALIHYTGVNAVLNCLPSVKPRTGKWVSADNLFGGIPYHCDQCGETTLETCMGKPRWNYCPNCGADMRGEKNETD